MYLNPPSSYFNKASRNRVLSSSPDPAIHSIAFAKPHRLLLAIPQSFPSFKTLSTLWIGVGCVWVQISSQGMTMREGWRKGYNDFSLRMSNFLSKRWVCVVENLFRVFFSEWPLLHLWVTRVYIAWVKGKQVTHKKKKKLQAKSFATISQEGLACETLTKTTAWHDSSDSSHVLLTCLFAGTLIANFSRASREMHWSSVKLESSPT